MVKGSSVDKNEGKSDLIPEKKSVAFIHIRVDPEFKRDLLEKVEEEDTNLTAYVVNTLSADIYKKEIEEEDEEDLLREDILGALENLERRVEIRLSTLQDTFNSLIGKLIALDTRKSSTRRGKSRKQQAFVEEDDELSDVLDKDEVLKIRPEEMVYSRVKRFVETKGVAEVPDFQEIILHLETDAQIKEFFQRQEETFPGWKESMVTDAIEEAIEELGISLKGRGGGA